MTWQDKEAGDMIKSNGEQGRQEVVSWSMCNKSCGRDDGGNRLTASPSTLAYRHAESKCWNGTRPHGCAAPPGPRLLFPNALPGSVGLQ